jgi:mono/diheme cytochrome c family protein
MTSIILSPPNGAWRTSHVTLQSRTVRIASLWLFAMAAALSYASSAIGADPARGRALYENHCENCHTPKIHSRANKLPMSKHEVRLIVDDWRRQINLPWTPEEVEDVVEYLNVTRYKFAPD